MANDFDYISGVPTTELLGGSQVRAVTQVSARAKPSGVQFSTVVAQADLVPSHLSLILSTIAAAVNEANDVPGVADVNLYQDVNNQGQFVNKLDVTVESTSGNTSAVIHPAYGTIFDDRFAAAVERERAQLDAVEAL